jgi:hypothetical protein
MTVLVGINGTDLSIKYGRARAYYSPVSVKGSWDDIIDLDTNDYSSTIVGGYLVVYQGGKPAR